MFTKIIKALNGFVERLTPKQLLFGTVAAGMLICLLVFMTLSHIENSLKAEIPEPVEMVKVVVARTNIPRGAVIQENMLRVKEFAVQSLPEGVASDTKFFVGLPTKLEIFKDDIVTAQKVFTDYREAGFIGMIPDDSRAVSIPIDNVSGVSGLIKPGDYVDIILVTSKGKGTKAEVILQNVLLLSINKKTDREIQDIRKSSTGDKDDDGDGTDPLDDAKKDAENLKARGENLGKDAASAFEGKGAKGLGAAGGGSGGTEDLGTATLALKPNDVTKIAASLATGTLQLALRPLKPRGASMYIAETEYVISQGGDNSGGFLDRQNQEYRRQTPTLQPQPVVTPPPVAVVSQSKTPDDDGKFEVIQWGGK